ncbi:hypothetical protein KUTeg_015976 [Tegillarca granosa]|uniref:EF-hand domain-containing protein n=1 Tax=Tegillarca granosa TaxID=220873 RepID=A0ABQ9EM23_TEGGR|nr:hypothetical protein KUTeg_015976 [Tegillarca granosa]
MIDGAELLLRGSPNDKLKFLFDLMDMDGNGSIDRNELKIAITACMEESSQSFSDDKVEALTEILFESADNGASGKISYDELANDGLQWGSPPKPKKTENSCSRHLSSQYLKNNALKIVYFIIYLLLNVALGVYAGWTYRKSNDFIIIARISVTVSKKTDALEMWEILFTTKADIGWIKGSAFITGWILILLFIILYIFAMPYFRRRGFFELFYFTHMLYIPVWVCLNLHGPHFWKWFLVPGTVFIIEKLIRTKIIQLAGLGNMYIKEVDLLPAGMKSGFMYVQSAHGHQNCINISTIMNT